MLQRIIWNRLHELRVAHFVDNIIFADREVEYFLRILNLVHQPFFLRRKPGLLVLVIAEMQRHFPAIVSPDYDFLLFQVDEDEGEHSN